MVKLVITGTTVQLKTRADKSEVAYGPYAPSKFGAHSRYLYEE